MDLWIVLAINIGVVVAVVGLLYYIFTVKFANRPPSETMMHMMRTSNNSQLDVLQKTNSDFIEETRAARKEAMKRAEEEVFDLRDRVNTLATRYTESVEEVRKLRDEYIVEIRAKGEAEKRAACLEAELRMLKERG